MARGKRQSVSNKKKKGKKKGAKAQQEQQQQAQTHGAPHQHIPPPATAAVNQARPASQAPPPPTTPSTNTLMLSRRSGPRSKLESLPPHLLFQIVTHLDQRGKDVLFHVVTGNDISPTTTTSSNKEKEEKEEENDGETNGSSSSTSQQQNSPSSPSSSNSPSSPPSLHSRWRVPMEFVTSDSDTLLARLNTRRLFKRKGDDYTFPVNMTTEEIALYEWNNILERATQQGRVPEQQLPPLIAPSKELLMFTPCPRSVAVLASFPRSGNSLLRTLYEKITLRVSGSDMRGGLVHHDLVGEAAVSCGKVQFCKTHYPERRGIKPYQASRVVLLVRNPYDALESYFNLMTTGTHTSTLNAETRLQLQHVWQSMVKKEIQVWQAFHEFWLAQDIPLLLVRYEDLIRYPNQVMNRVIKFVLEINNMDFFSQRIARCVAEETIEQLGSYQPRSGGIGKSLAKYSPEMLQQINFGIFDTMEQLDYTSMLIPNKEEWELEPLPDFAREYYNNPDNTVTVNDENVPLVRTPKHRTNWAKLKREMKEMSAGTCHCAKCVGRGR